MKGPATRKEIDRDEKIRKFADMGFKAIQFHDDDAVPNINDYTEEEIKEKARELKKFLDSLDLEAEFVAPRLWMDEHTADGGSVMHIPLLTSTWSDSSGRLLYVSAFAIMQ